MGICLSYRRWSWCSSSAATPETVPVNSPVRGKKDGVVRGIGQHREHRLGQSKYAGRILETAGSTSDLKSHRTVALLGREIYAIVSLRHIDLQ